MLTATLVITVILLVLYNSRFANVRTRSFTIVAIFARAFGTIMFSYIVEPGISSKNSRIMFVINALTFLPLEEAFLLKPALMVFAKCIPHKIEGLMLGLATSMYKFSFDIVMRLVSIWILKNHITIDDYNSLGSTMRACVGVQLLSLITLKYLYDRKEVTAVQIMINNIDKMTP